MPYVSYWKFPSIFTSFKCFFMMVFCLKRKKLLCEIAKRWVITLPKTECKEIWTSKAPKEERKFVHSIFVMQHLVYIVCFPYLFDGAFGVHWQFTKKEKKEKAMDSWPCVMNPKNGGYGFWASVCVQPSTCHFSIMQNNFFLFFYFFGIVLCVPVTDCHRNWGTLWLVISSTLKLQQCDLN